MFSITQSTPSSCTRCENIKKSHLFFLSLYQINVVIIVIVMVHLNTASSKQGFKSFKCGFLFPLRAYGQHTQILFHSRQSAAVCFIVPHDPVPLQPLSAGLCSSVCVCLSVPPRSLLRANARGTADHCTITRRSQCLTPHLLETVARRATAADPVSEISSGSGLVSLHFCDLGPVHFISVLYVHYIQCGKTCSSVLVV